MIGLRAVVRVDDCGDTRIDNRVARQCGHTGARDGASADNGVDDMSVQGDRLDWVVTAAVGTGCFARRADVELCGARVAALRISLARAAGPFLTLARGCERGGDARRPTWWRLR